MNPLLEALRSASAADRDLYRPVFFRTAVAADAARLEDLLKRGPVTVLDHLHGQLTELVRALNPSIKFAPADLDRMAVEHLGDTPAENYGVWVYYPWSQRLVHLLDEAEFALVRTDRNRNKITREEQALLATKKVGVIGLSVGQSASLTMAQERSFGELRLADFDTLELSNLNRIRSGVHELGNSKVVNTAREIAEIDPFLRVTCFPEGITTDNIDRFLTEGGNLDLLVEECDSVAVKIQARQRAKALRIPVVMDTSDRGLIDVERFDLEPDRPILHGLVDHLDLSLAAKAKTNEEKLPFVIPIIGLDTMSARMKASMLEIENSVTTWPQLGSAVALGGAIVAHVGRRILVGQPTPSGRWWMDPDDHFGQSESAQAVAQVQMRAQATLDLAAMLHAADRVTGVPSDLTRLEAERIASAGILAPTGGNCQPWRFLHAHGRLFVFLDGERARSALDPGMRYALLGMGACVENMLLEGKRLGIPLEYIFTPQADTPQLVAVLSRKPGDVIPDREDSTLAAWLRERCTNRKYYALESIADDLAGELGSSVGELASLHLVRDLKSIEQISQLCGKAERIRFLNPTCHHDMFVREMRWTEESTKSTRDGIDLETLELSATDRTGIRVAADAEAVSLLRSWQAGKVMDKLTAKTIRASGALAILSISDLSLSSAFEGGRALERFWLKASSLGLAVHPVSAPIFMGIHGLWDEQRILTPVEHQEAAAILSELKRITGIQDQAPLFMMRLGKSGPPSARSLRLPLDAVFHSTAPLNS